MFCSGKKKNLRDSESTISAKGVVVAVVFLVKLIPSRIFIQCILYMYSTEMSALVKINGFFFQLLSRN